MRALVLAAAVLACTPAWAGRRHAIYGELFGKGGLVGAGYDYRVARRVTVGGTLAFYPLAGDQVYSASPYLGVYPWPRWFVHAGPQLVHVRTPAPVPEWPGRSSTGVSAQVSAGWEKSGPVLVRVFVMVAAGKGGIAPWAGLSLGWSF